MKCLSSTTRRWTVHAPLVPRIQDLRNVPWRQKLLEYLIEMPLPRAMSPICWIRRKTRRETQLSVEQLNCLPKSFNLEYLPSIRRCCDTFTASSLLCGRAVRSRRSRRTPPPMRHTRGREPEAGTLGSFLSVSCDTYWWRASQFCSQRTRGLLQGGGDCFGRVLRTPASMLESGHHVRRMATDGRAMLR